MPTVLERVKTLKEKSKKRNFVQRYDLIVNLKEFDPDKPENKIDEIVPLPHGTGKNVTITVFADELKLSGYRIVKGSEIPELEKNKKNFRKLIKETELFFAEPKLMPVVGKHLGKYLAPRGLMPRPITGNIQGILENYKRGVKISTKKQPVIHTVVGSENMKDEEIVENIKAVLNFLKAKLPRGANNIKNVCLKLTMGPVVELEVDQFGK